MILKEWSDVPVSVRTSRRKLWNYLVSEINGDGGTTEPTTGTDSEETGG